MPRSRRYEIVDIPQHVVQRGNNRQPTFFAPRDRHFYLKCLRESAIRYQCEIHAYVLMTNHVHLLVTPRQPMAIAGVMQSVGRRYVRYVNGCYNRTGTLWEGRYRASLVARGEYLMCCYRYIELNPVRAKIVTDPADYPWTSFRRNAWGRHDSIVTDHDEYSMLGAAPQERAAAYRAMFHAGIEPARLNELRRDLHESRPFGPECFKEEIERRLKRRFRAIKPGPKKPG